MNETFHGGCTVNTTTSSDAFWVDALGQRHAPCIGPARIVSLVPSLTELVCDLGLAGQLVGRTGFCIHPKATLRSITSTRLFTASVKFSPHDRRLSLMLIRVLA